MLRPLPQAKRNFVFVFRLVRNVEGCNLAWVAQRPLLRLGMVQEDSNVQFTRRPSESHGRVSDPAFNYWIDGVDTIAGATASNVVVDAVSNTKPPRTSFDVKFECYLQTGFSDFFFCFSHERLIEHDHWEQFETESQP